MKSLTSTGSRDRVASVPSSSREEGNMKRRTFVKASAAAGLQGILVSRIAPAVAQSTTLAWLRWNDFVPASDQLLREEILPAAQKALGFRARLETLHAYNS